MPMAPAAAPAMEAPEHTRSSIKQEFYRNTHVNQNAAQARKPRGVLQVVDQRTPHGEWTPGTEMVIPLEQNGTIILPRDITEERKCWEAEDYGHPRCAGDACLPCYAAHLFKRHGLGQMAQFQDIIKTWHGVFSDMTHMVDPRVVLQRHTEHDAVPDEATIRCCVLHMAQLILALHKATRAQLAQNGGVRMTKDEVLGKTKAGRLHSDMGIEAPIHFTHRVVRYRRTKDDPPL